MDQTVIIVVIMLMVCMSLSLAGLVMYIRNKKNKKNTNPTAAGSSTGGSTGGSTTSGGWKSASATYFDSYPACCPKAPNYSASANKSECTDYSGCAYLGQFAGVSGKLTYDQVKVRNIVSFYDATNQSKGACAQKNKECPWWNENAKNKKLIIKNPATGKELEVEALDTCSDADCNKCCTKNALKGGGTLIDIEHFTAIKFWGGAPRNGKIQWRWV